MNEIIRVINYFSAYQAFSMGILLINRKQNRFSNNILAVILIITALRSCVVILVQKNIISPIYFLTFILLVIFFSSGPLLHLYSRSMIGEVNSISKREALHFLFPVLIGLFYFVLSYSARFIHRSDFNIDASFGFLHPILSFLYYIYALYLVGYTLASGRALYPVFKEIEDYFSNVKGLRMLWLRNFLVIHFLIYTSSIVSGIFTFFNPFRHIYSSFSVILNFILIMVTFSFLQRRPELFQYSYEMLEKLKKTREEVQESRKKYKKTDIKESKKDEYEMMVKDYMLVHRPYLVEDISLKKLSDSLNIPSYLLSMIINERFNQNFYSFINLYRINHALDLMKDPASEKENILSIALDCGFNSKSSFNVAFKAVSGMTPSEYRKKVIFHSEQNGNA